MHLFLYNFSFSSEVSVCFCENLLRRLHLQRETVGGHFVYIYSVLLDPTLIQCSSIIRVIFERKRMEGGKKSQTGSSFTSDLFGSKDSTSGSVFGSLLAPPDKLFGRESLHSYESWKKDDAANQGWSGKTGFPLPNNKAPSNEDKSQSSRSKDITSYFQEEKPKPCSYSSSIYYGGQDLYTLPESTQGSFFTTFTDEAEDDSGMASRGNWWKGSLYY